MTTGASTTTNVQVKRPAPEHPTPLRLGMAKTDSAFPLRRLASEPGTTIHIQRPEPRYIKVRMPGQWLVWGCASLTGATNDDGSLVVEDLYGIAWGEGLTVEDAVADWHVAAREILDMLNGQQHLSGPMEARREILRSWIR